MTIAVHKSLISLYKFGYILVNYMCVCARETCVFMGVHVYTA